MLLVRVYEGKQVRLVLLAQSKQGQSATVVNILPLGWLLRKTPQKRKCTLFGRGLGLNNSFHFFGFRTAHGVVIAWSGGALGLGCLWLGVLVSGVAGLRRTAGPF